MASTPETRAIIRVLEEFHKIEPDITITSMLALLYVNEKDGQSGNQTYVSSQLKMTGATASRAISYWAPYKSPRVKGQDMLESIPDPVNRRYRQVTLTRKGLDFIGKLKEAVKFKV